MVLFNFNSNKEIYVETTSVPAITSATASSKYINTVWDGEFLDVEVGDGFVKQNHEKTDVDPNGREFVELHSGISPFFTNEEYTALKDPNKAEQVHEKKILKIKNQIRQMQAGNDPKFPINQYDIEVFFDGKYYQAYIYDVSTRPEAGKLSQSVNITRPDGIKIGIQDRYDGDIEDDDNAEWIDIREKDPFTDGLNEPSFSIDLPNGQKYTFKTLINGSCSLVDLRRQEKAIVEFFTRLPQSKIQELIDKNVRHITFYTEPDEEFADLYKLDENGEGVFITCDETLDDIGSAEIISPTFMPAKHNYHTEKFFKREDGYEITIIDDSQASSNVTFKLPNGKTQQLYVTSNTEDFNTDVYHQIMMPKLSKLINSLPENVIQDILNEVDEIKMTMDSDSAGVYSKGSNTLAINMYDYDSAIVDTHQITTIHELGHAVDNIGNKYISETPEFQAKYQEFQKLAEQYEFESIIKDPFYSNITFEDYQNGIGEYSVRNHALDNAQELFASVYANINFKGEDRSGDHIADLDKIILPFKNSDDPDKKHCYDLYIELKNIVKTTVDEVRAKPRSERANSRIKNIVSQMCKDIQKDMEFLDSKFIISLVAYSPELTITNWVSRTPEEFNEIISNFTKCATDENYSDDIKDAFKNIINKIQEIRIKVDEIQQ